METEELTLTSIDGSRHLTISHDMVKAVAFAARAVHSDVTVHRFVTALVMTDLLKDPFRWPYVMRIIKELEATQ